MIDHVTKRISKMEAIGIIPARFSSVRFPGKPLAEILGKSLIQRTYENAKRCKQLKRLVVATDDQRIFDHVRSFGGEVVMTSLNIRSGTDRLEEVIRNNPEYGDAEILVNIQGDEPCLDPQVIEGLILALQEDRAASVATPIAPLKSVEEAESPSTVKCVRDLRGFALYFSRSLIPGHLGTGLKPEVDYYRHIGIYAYRKEFLLHYASLKETPLQLAEDLEQLKILEHGYKIRTFLVDEPPLDVNRPEDIQKVESYLCKQNSSS